MNIEPSQLKKALRASAAYKRQKWPVFKQCRAVRCWWMDNVWPFRKEYPIKVSSHPVAKFLTGRKEVTR